MLPVLKIHFCLNCHHWTFFTKKVMEYMCICFCCANIRQFWNQDGGRRVQLWASMSPLDLWEPGFVLIFFSRKGHLQLRGEEPDPFVRCQGMLHAFRSFIHSSSLLFILSSFYSFCGQIYSVQFVWRVGFWRLQVKNLCFICLPVFNFLFKLTTTFDRIPA